MVLLTMTTSIVEALRILNKATNSAELHCDDKCQSETNTPKEPSLEDPEVGKPISHGQIIDIWKHLNSHDGDVARLEALLRGATIYTPPPPPKQEQTREYKVLMARLRREEEERSYERMLKKAPPRESFVQRYPFAPMAHSFAEVNRPSKASDLGDDDIEHGDIQKQITLVFNFLVSIVGCGVALWLASRWWSVPARLFLSLGGSIVVAIAEVAVYSAYTWRMAEGEKKEKQMREVKEIVKTWVVGEDDEKKDTHAPTELLKEAPGSLEPDMELRRRTKGPI